MWRRTARSPATAETVREAPGSFLAGELKRRGGYSRHYATQAVYSGMRLLGFLRHRSNEVEAFDAAGRSVGIFSDQKAALDAISARAGS